jgi:hypothetical protein
MKTGIKAILAIALSIYALSLSLPASAANSYQWVMDAAKQLDDQNEQKDRNERYQREQSSDSRYSVTIDGKTDSYTTGGGLVDESAPTQPVIDKTYRPCNPCKGVR